MPSELEDEDMLLEELTGGLLEILLLDELLELDEPFSPVPQPAIVIAATSIAHLKTVPRL